MVRVHYFAGDENSSLRFPQRDVLGITEQKEERPWVILHKGCLERAHTANQPLYARDLNSVNNAMEQGKFNK